MFPEELKISYKFILLSLSWILIQACSFEHYNLSSEQDDLYFNAKDSKKWQVQKNPAYDANYKTPAPTPSVVDPNEYQFTSGQSTNTKSAPANSSGSNVTTRTNKNPSRVRTNFTVGTMFGPSMGYNAYNSFNISWYYSNLYGYNSYWSPYSYTPYYCNTYINPYAGYWYGPYSMPMYPYGYNNYGNYNPYGYNSYYNGYSSMYYQPNYMSYPTYYTPQSGYNTVSTPASAPRPMTGSTTGNSNYPSGNTASPYQNKSYTPSTNTQPNSTSYPRGTQSNPSSSNQYNPAPQQPRQSYTPQNSYHPPQQSHTPSQHNFNPSPRPSGGGSSGTPNPRMR